MNDLAIQLTEDGSRHLYEQIYEYIRDEIKEGKLLAGEKLPSTRSLAEYLQVARSTVELAYGQLLSEGYIEASAYRGYYVCRVEELYQMMSELSREKGDGADKPDLQQKQQKAFDYDFSPNAIDMSAFPFGTWRKITKEILSGGRDICVAFENPSYRRAYRIFSSFASGVVTVPVDENGISVKQLALSGANVAYCMPSHQYPTGVVMPIGRRMELLKWAAGASDRYLIEDDYDSEFRYRGKPVPSLQASDTAGKVIYIGTFSKSIAPAIRVSFMVLPPALLKRYEKECGFFSSTVSRIDQTILNEFIRSGAFERHLNKMRKLYKEKHDILLEELKPLLKKYRLSGEYAGLHVLLTSREHVEEEALLRRAEEKRVRLYGLHEASLGPALEQEATLLIGYAGLGKEEIREGIGRLREVL